MKKIGVSIISTMIGAAAAGIIVEKKKNKDIKIWYDIAKKNDAILKMMNYWLELKQKGVSVADKLTKCGYKDVAIYGMGFVGERLYDELKDSKLNVKFAIDKQANEKHAEINIVTPEEMKEKVDVIIVTAIYFYEQIEEELVEKVDCPIISLEDIIYE